jgi:signal transduction histidine kinase
MNILTNAIDAIEERDRNLTPAEIAANPGEIAISTEVKDGGNVWIVIADNGPGMPESVKDRIFDPFFTTKEVGKGTGLGMSISYQIVVEQHGGQLNCISEPGKGTAFQIEIPIQQASGLSSCPAERLPA